MDNETVRIDMPEENSFVRFHSGQYKLKVPYLIYTDFEVILEKPLQGLEEEFYVDEEFHLLKQKGSLSL